MQLLIAVVAKFRRSLRLLISFHEAQKAKKTVTWRLWRFSVEAYGSLFEDQNASMR